MASSSINNLPMEEPCTEYSVESDVSWEAAKAKIGPAINRNTRTLAHDETNKKNKTDDSEEALRLVSVKAGIELFIGISETISANDQKSACSGDACGKSVEMVLEKCPELLMKANKKEETPLHLAARYGNKRVLKLLIERAKALYNKDMAKADAEDGLSNPDHYRYPPNRAGKIPLFTADERGYNRVMFEILRRCSSPPNGDPHARNALHAAAIVGDQDLEDKTALHIAAWKGHEKIMMDIILECSECLQAITDEYSLSHLLNATDHNGNTPLHLIASARTITEVDVRILLAFLDLSRVDHKLPLNRKNQNALDIYNKMLSASHKGKHRLKKQKKANIIPRRRSDDEKENVEEIVDSVADIEKAQESTLGTAALIATVTFTAAFTMPGGYASSDGARKAGTPILAKSNAFQVFILVDTIALAVSSWAVYYHILVVLSKSKLKKVKFYDKAVYLTTYAMISILIAFVTGTYVVLETSKSSLAISVCIIGTSVAFLYSMLGFHKFEKLEGSCRKDAT
ncbi:hypothetical protein TIFTF001_000641 [Ficus carica]|uniref:PGG domain-containing protein n=1 Tax=Ficus carica TaxID=3494 RepID=A0AA87Z3Q6_FICCA|nr:hypothetical protein TIFTF001_000641 [Ficus carica]